MARAKKAANSFLETASMDDPEARKAMREMFGPQMIDHQVRKAISACWMMLPDERKTVANVESEILRIVNRALKDLRKDSQAFGIHPRN